MVCTYLPKKTKQSENLQQAHGQPRLTNACGKHRLACLIQSHRRVEYTAILHIMRDEIEKCQGIRADVNPPSKIAAMEP